MKLLILFALGLLSLDMSYWTNSKWRAHVAATKQIGCLNLSVAQQIDSRFQAVTAASELRLFAKVGNLSLGYQFDSAPRAGRFDFHYESGL